MLSLVVAFTAGRPPSTPGPLERDFEAYYAAGATYNAGLDPYSRAVWTAEARIPGVDVRRDELLPFVGPAAVLPLWSALARLPYRAALATWTAFLLGAFLTIVVCTLRVTGRRLDRWGSVAIIALSLGSAPLLGALALGQAALVAAAGLAAAIVLYPTRALAAAAIATFVAAVQPNVAFALVAGIRSRAAIVCVGVAAAAFAALSWTFGGGIAGFVVYLHRLASHGVAERFVTIQYTPGAIAYAFGATPVVARLTGTVTALATIVVTVAATVRGRLDATTATFVACAALPLAVPFFHEHDFAIEALPLLVLALRSQGAPRAWASVAAVLVLVDWFGLAQRHGAQVQVLALGFTVACAFIALGPSPTAPRGGLEPALAGLAVLLVLGALAAPLAAKHLAPTWPDNLPVTYHADPRADASAVWGDEQRAAGLTVADPVWGLLRLVPLAGCLLLAGALVADGTMRRRLGLTGADIAPIPDATAVVPTPGIRE